MIDHIVIRSKDKLEECRTFYSLLGMETERYNEYQKWAKGETLLTGAIFPSMRINDNAIIDLLSSKMSHIENKKTEG